MATITKKLINKVEDCVNESIAGFISIHSGIRTLAGQPRVIVRADLEQYKKSGRVTTLTGGGSGHEPYFLGIIGEGMMTGAVHGDLFAAPAPSTILAALRALGSNHKAGVLVVFNNYTGDRLNFGIAVERAQAEGIQVEIVINGDDCAVHSKDKTAGRRGLTGSLLVMKIIGHLAERGESLMHIKQIASDAASQVASMGVCWSPCSLPGGAPLFHLGPDEMELGLGVHGEAGMKRLKMQNAHDTVLMMIKHMTNAENPAHLLLKKGDRVAVLLNNLGSASDIEMNVAAGEAIFFLERDCGVRVERAYSGRFVTSQEMAGLIITLMILDDIRSQCLDAETKAVCWVKPFLDGSGSSRSSAAPLEIAGLCGDLTASKKAMGPQIAQNDFDKLFHAIAAACEALIKNKDFLNKLDSGCGDGDCGSTISSGAKAVLERIKSKELAVRSPMPSVLLMELAETVERTMGGCSGALYSLMLTSAATQMAKETTCHTDSWARALGCAIETISRYGGAEPGDRTLLDPLNAAWKKLNEAKNSDELQRWKEAVKAAETEADRTAKMLARAGRASYVSRDLLNQPDPGAKAVVIWMSAILDSYTAAQSRH